MIGNIIGINATVVIGAPIDLATHVIIKLAPP